MASDSQINAGWARGVKNPPKPASLEHIRARLLDLHAHRSSHAECELCREYRELLADLKLRDVAKYIPPNAR